MLFKVFRARKYYGASGCLNSPRGSIHSPFEDSAEPPYTGYMWVRRVPIRLEIHDVLVKEGRRHSKPMLQFSVVHTPANKASPRVGCWKQLTIQHPWYDLSDPHLHVETCRCLLYSHSGFLSSTVQPKEPERPWRVPPPRRTTGSSSGSVGLLIVCGFLLQPS